jgi:hypothetical protein
MMGRWVDCLAVSAWLIDVARGAGNDAPLSADTLALWDAERALVAAGRRLLHKAEAA